jgi:hypothetical protein
MKRLTLLFKRRIHGVHGRTWNIVWIHSLKVSKRTISIHWYQFYLDYRKTSATTTDSIQNERKPFFEDVSCFLNFSLHIIILFLFILSKLPHIEIEINFHKLDLNLFAPKTTNARYIYSNQFKFFDLYSFRFPINGCYDEMIACISVSNARINMKKMSITSRVEYVGEYSLFLFFLLFLLRCIIELESVRMFGMERDKQYRPLLLTPISSSCSPLVHVEFELFSAKEKSDYRLHLIIEPIQIIYHAVNRNEKRQLKIVPIENYAVFVYFLANN